MTARVAQIWRHPIKSHGREELAETKVTKGECLPWDRRWAVAHERSCFDVERPRWQPCQEFSIGAKSQRLQAINTYVDAQLGRLTLSHPDCVDITIDPDKGDDANRFIQWVMPISNGARMLPARLVRGAQAMTDTDYKSISIINLATHRAIEEKHGRPLSPLRWRGNILIDGWNAWAEMDMVGQKIRIGQAEFEIREQITRCMATTADPATGQRDADTLGILNKDFGHQELGVYAVASATGDIHQGDTVEVV